MIPSEALADCAREPIHIPGAIQPHGILFSVTEPELVIVQVSDNVASEFGAIAQLLGTRLSALLEHDSLDALQTALSRPALDAANPLRIVLRGGLAFDGVAHRADGLLVLELEPAPEERSEPVSYFSFYHSVREALVAAQSGATLEEVADRTCHEVRRLTGFHRVLMYRFHEDWHGSVVGEARAKHMPSYLGLRFPESDIPAQARQLYVQNTLRLIANVDYKPARLTPQLNPVTGQPLNLGQAVLRSVSPVHLEYMRNMGVYASMSISILVEGRLWGLISCHHSAPRYTDFQVRSACELVGHFVGQRIAALEAEADQVQRLELDRRRLALTTAAEAQGLDDLVAGDSGALPAYLDAAGFALVRAERVLTVGETPDDAAIRRICEALNVSASDGATTTRELGQVFEVAPPLLDVAAGVLALPLRRAGGFLAWFRPQVVRTVDWAGNPNKPVEQSDGGPARLHPRGSFEQWQETVRGCAEAWTTPQRDAAVKLRNDLLARELERAQG